MVMVMMTCQIDTHQRGRRRRLRTILPTAAVTGAAERDVVC